MSLDLLPQQGSSGSVPAFLAELLAEQQELSAVERFAQRPRDLAEPLQARYYSALLPASPPGPGEQYAFDVDLDRCSGCKACVTACHQLNGLDDDEAWRGVGLLHGGTAMAPVLQHVTTACHHCLDPACMSACPTRAYEKDPVTGIVRHLDDQCFGCQYCILACPYEVPRYNPQRGIVRKCDMCSQRLAVGEAPGCVQACPHEAIRIRVVSVADVEADCEANPFLPGAPDPRTTQPTTNYRSARPFPRNMLPADYHSVRAEHAHPPLIVMLVLTQLSVGTFLIGQILDWLFPAATLSAGLQPLQSVSALFLAALALGASTLHLGRPWLAYRAVLGLRTSWLSREIVVFGAFAGLAALQAVVCWMQPNSSSAARAVLEWGVVLSGLAGVFCSAMIYTATGRPTWAGPATLVRFSLTTLWLGLATVLFLVVMTAGLMPDRHPEPQLLFAQGLCRVLVSVAALKLMIEASVFAHLTSKQMTPLYRTARLMCGDLGAWTGWRFACGIVGGLMLPGWLGSMEMNMSPVLLTGLSAACVGLSVAGELLERTLYFMAAVAPRMPGGLRT